MSTRDESSTFWAVVSQQIARFPETRLIRLLDQGDLRLPHYHALLATLFHQTHAGPYTFARAAVNCPWRFEGAKEYLLRHADEEKGHWRWLLSDLESTGYCGPDLRMEPPHPTCQAFLGLNYYVAEEAPLARLAIAAVLEGIGSTHGGTYGPRVLQALGLKASQASFFLSHGETDKTHTQELADVIAGCRLGPDEWRWMERAAETAGALYRGMYDHEAFR